MREPVETVGVNWFWILTLLVQLSPFEIKVDIPGTDEKLYVSINLDMKK